MAVRPCASCSPASRPSACATVPTTPAWCGPRSTRHAGRVAGLATPGRVARLTTPPSVVSAVETLDTYSHLWPDSDERTPDAIDSVLGFTADALRMEAAPTS